jgi:hypothetical protein
MVMASGDSQDLIYTHIMPKWAKINSNYTVKALGTFIRHLKKKRPDMVSREWFIHWDIAPIHTAALVPLWMAANMVQVLEHPPYLPDLALATTSCSAG